MIEQPLPVSHQEQPDCWDRLITDMIKRRKLGIERYKTPLQPFNGRDILRDKKEELLDALVYAEQEEIELDWLFDKIKEILVILSYDNPSMVYIRLDDLRNILFDITDRFPGRFK